MTLTLNEENIFRKQIKIQKFEQQLQNVMSPQPVLTPTKDTEISTLKQQIKAEEVHTTHTEYVKKVQPMKNDYKVLVAENKQIEINNKAAIDAARSTDESVRQKIIDNINILKEKIELLLQNI